MARVTVPAVNTELAQRGIQAILYKERGYFMFRGPDVTEWLNRTVQADKVSDLSMEQWLAAYDDLKRQNAAILKKTPSPRRGQTRKATPPAPRGPKAAPSSKSSPADKGRRRRPK